MNIINDDVTDFLDQAYRPQDNEMKAFREQCEPEIPIILKSTEDFMRAVLTMKKPARILEIGTATGYSASFMAKLLPNCRITTIERDEERYRAAEENFRRLGLADRIDARFGEAGEVIEGLSELSGGNGFQFIFIDASKSHYREFWDSAVKTAAPEAVVMCDNVLMKASVADDKYDENRKFRTSIKKMRGFLSYITNLGDVETSVMTVGDGVSISVLQR